MWLTFLLPVSVFVLSSNATKLPGSSSIQQDETVPVALVTALMDRIDQLERRLEERDTQHAVVATLIDHNDQLEKRLEEWGRQHADDINKLHTDYQMQLDKQAEQISSLETTVQKQQQEINDLKEGLTEPHCEGQTIEQNQKVSVVLKGDHLFPKAITKQRIRRAENEVEIAFFSTLSATASHLGTNQNIIFDRVVTNIGNGYHAPLGSFIAPVAGTYVFSVTLTTDGRHTSHYALYKDTDLLVKIHLHGDENSYDSSSQSAVLHLAQGDDVTVRHLSTDHSVYGDNFCAFSGFLLNQDFTGGSPIIGK